MENINKQLVAMGINDLNLVKNLNCHKYFLYKNAN